MLATMFLFGAPPRFGNLRPMLFILLAALLLPLLQLVPLPPEVWQALPGRAMFTEAAAMTGQPQPWRPLSIVPGATRNAAASLVVPIAAIIFIAGLKDKERAWLPVSLLGMIVTAMLLGLLQFSGAAFNDPFINDTPGQVSANFANRNHFAIFVAIGCVLAPAWAFLDDRKPKWRAPLALALVMLFVMTIMASGSRAGFGLGMLGVGAGLLVAWRPIRRTLRRYPRWVAPALALGAGAALLLVVLTSVTFDRAVSLDRLFAPDQGQDMRARGLPTVLSMTRTYFPVGSGLGSFDPIFRLNEPFDLLKPTYFNHAHNDIIEIVLDAGVPGALLLAAAICWWATASALAWRSKESGTLARTGSAMILIVLLASLVDYPVRTPLMMTVVVIAAAWLSGENGGRNSPALPLQDQHL